MAIYFFYYKNAAKNSTTSNCQKIILSVYSLDSRRNMLKTKYFIFIFHYTSKKYILLKFQMKKEKIKMGHIFDKFISFLIVFFLTLD